LYSKKEYLRASDILSDIIISYPNFESPKHFYNGIKNMMIETVEQNDKLDFDRILYAMGYVNYYKANYKDALSDWKKYISFKGENDEIREYIKKIDSELKLKELVNREQKLKIQSNVLFEDGIKKYKEGKWIACIKKMETLEKFVTRNNFSQTIDYYDKAKSYINKSVAELLKNIDYFENKVDIKEKFERDEGVANEKYTEGLVLYAQGKYYEAERLWELALRLNPNHKKAKVALGKVKAIYVSS
jgi:tetratricopeptide (TPR) repeat protein